MHLLFDQGLFISYFFKNKARNNEQKTLYPFPNRASGHYSTIIVPYNVMYKRVLNKVFCLYRFTHSLSVYFKKHKYSA